MTTIVNYSEKLVFFFLKGHYRSLYFAVQNTVNWLSYGNLRAETKCRGYVEITRNLGFSGTQCIVYSVHEHRCL